MKLVERENQNMSETLPTEMGGSESTVTQRVKWDRTDPSAYSFKRKSDRIGEPIRKLNRSGKKVGVALRQSENRSFLSAMNH